MVGSPPPLYLYDVKIKLTLPLVGEMELTGAMPAKKPSSKDKYHHGDLRKALIEASLSIIAREGAEALTLRSAARAAGVSHAAPYAHYEDKEDLIAAVKDDCFKELQQQLAEGLGEKDAPLVRLESMARIYLAFAADHPAKYTIMFKRPLGKEPRETFAYIEIGRDIFRMLAEEVAAALIAHGRKVDPQDVTLTS